MFGQSYSQVGKINARLLHLGLKMRVPYPDGRFIHNQDMNEVIHVCQLVQHGMYQQATNYATKSGFGMLTQTKMLSLINYPQFFQKALPLIKQKESLIQVPLVEKSDAKLRKYQYKVAKHSKHDTLRQRAIVQKYQNKIKKIQKQKNQINQI